MVIALKHNDTIIIGCYENLMDFILSNFTYEFTENRHVKVKSKHFNSYIKKEIISNVSYGKDYTKEEAVRDYFKNYFSDQLKAYDINIHFTI